MRASRFMVILVLFLAMVVCYGPIGCGEDEEPVQQAGGAVKMYWAAENIYRADTDGSNVEEIVSGLRHPTFLAVHKAGERIYWLDAVLEEPGMMQRAGLDGSDVEDVITDLGYPAGIALDPAGGKVYWTEWVTDSGKIRRANLDGSSPEDVLMDLIGPTWTAPTLKT